MDAATEMTHAAGEQTEQQWPISVVRAGRKAWDDRDSGVGLGTVLGVRTAWVRQFKKLDKNTKTLQEAAFIPEIGSLK